MTNHFDDASDAFRRGVIQRISRITQDSRMDPESALLENANTARYSRSESEVIDLYREILRRDSSPKRIRLQALLNLTDYLFNYRSKRDAAVKVLGEYVSLFSDEPSAVKRYANYCWAEQKRDDAIRILDSFLGSRRPKGGTDIEIEIRGLSLMYRSIVAIERKEALKTDLRMLDITRAEFRDGNRESRRELGAIYERRGMPLFHKIRSIGLDNLSAGARQNVVTGLYNFCDVCIRLQRYDSAREVCRFALEQSRSFLADSYRIKLGFVDSLARAEGPTLGPGDRFVTS